MEVKGRRDLHKSLELLLKKSEKGLPPQMGPVGSPGKNKGMNQRANPLKLFMVVPTGFEPVLPT
jgi:hypothetical protein